MMPLKRVAVGVGGNDAGWHKLTWPQRARTVEEELRAHELDRICALFPPGARILELGAGTGYQAARLSERGFDVTALDLPDAERTAEYFPVVPFDGIRLPIATGSVDVVFSSNVLEHVEDLPGLLAETSRVLRAGGMAVHTMPSPTWRAAATILHPVAGLVQQLARRRVGSAPTAGTPTDQRHLARRRLLPGPHGNFPSAWAELREYSSHAWSKCFTHAGFAVEKIQGLGLFYSGHCLSHLTIRQRKVLARCLGSSCVLYRVAPRSNN